MKKIVLFLLVMVVAMPTKAQGEVGTWTFIPKVGLNAACSTDPDIYTTEAMDAKLKLQSRLRFVVGAEAEYQHTAALSYTVGLLYSQQGYKFGHDSDFGDYRVSLDYLNLPLLVNAYVAPGLALKSGIQFGAALHRSTRQAEPTASGALTYVSGNASGYRWYDVSWPVGVSYAVGSFQVDVRYNHGLNYIHKLGSLIPYRNRVWQFTLGYRL